MKVIILTGPTGIGKSSLAHEIAKEYGAAIVSADAMTVYRGMDIATAKPTPEQRKEVCYYGIDAVEPNESFSVYDFTLLVDHALEMHSLVIITGGTPFYLRALLKPHAPMPSANQEIRDRLKDISSLHEMLTKVDPISAHRLHPNDRIRLVRALEVYELTGRPMSSVQADPPSRKPLDCKVLWMDRDDLRPFLMKRIIEMVEEGYVEETKGLLAKGFTLKHRPMSSFSYLHMVRYINEEITFDECLQEIEKHTWYLARKQRTWSRNMGLKPISREEAYEELKRFCEND